MKKNKSLFYSILLIGVIIWNLSSCQKEQNQDPLEEAATPINESIDTITFHYNTNTHNLTFSNISEEEIQWQFTANDNFIKVDQSQGLLKAGEVQSLLLSINRSQILSDSLFSSIQLKSSLGDIWNIPIRIFNIVSRKYMFDFEVNKAAYSPSNNQLYLRPWNYYESDCNLFILDLDSYVLQGKELNFNYSHMQLSEDQEKLLLFDYRKVYVLDVENFDLLFNFEVSNNIKSLLMVGNEIYIFPNNNSYYDYEIYDIELDEFSSMQMGDFNFPSNFVSHLHPSGKYIYALNENAWHKNLVKLKIDGDENPHMIYSEEIDDFGEYFWMLNQGKKLFSNHEYYYDLDANIPGYDLSETKTIDLQGNEEIMDIIYNSELQEYYVHALSYSHENKNKIYVYNEELNYESTITADPYTIAEDLHWSVEYHHYTALINSIFYKPKHESLILISFPNTYNKGGLNSGLELIPLNK